MFGAQNWAPYFYEIKLIRVMKKTVQIVTIPLNKQTNFGIFKDVEDGEIIFTETSIKDNPYFVSQQLLVLSDDEILRDDWYLFDNAYLRKDAGYVENKGHRYKKVIASYPHIEGILPISKETIQAWIDSGTPGESDIEVQLMGSSMNTNMYFSIGDTLYTYNIDPQGNLLLEFQFSREQLLNKQEEAQSKMWDETNFSHKPSIPTDEEIERKAHNNYTYGYLMPIGSHDRSRYEEKKESYTSGYKQALKDLGHE
jgi:hypothetical protein